MFTPLKAAGAAFNAVGNIAIRVSALIYSLRRLGGLAG